MKIKLPYVALFSVFVLSLFVGSYTSGLSNTRLNTEFTSISKDLVEAIQYRSQIYIEVLHAGKALFDSSEYVSRREWNTFYKGLTINLRYPSLHAYEFVRYVPHEKKAAFIDGVRNDTSMNPQGYPDFAIWPEGNRDSYYVVDYVEPMAGNKKAFGLDTAFEEHRLKAIEKSRDSGETMSTSRITLVQEIKEQAAFLLFLPIYRHGMQQETVEERREAFVGFTTGVVRAGDLLKGVVEESHREFIDFAVYDTALFTEEEDLTVWDKQHLLYSTNNDAHTLITSTSPMKNTFTLSIAGREWTIISTPTETFLQQTSDIISILIVLSGTIIAFLIFLTLRSVEDSRESNERFRRFSESAYEGIFIHDRGVVLDVNNALAKMLGYKASELIGVDATSFVAPESVEITMKNILEGYEEPYEINAMKKDGTVCPLEIRGKNIYFQGTEARVVAVNDLSERKAHEEMLQTKNDELRHTLKELQSTQAQLIQAEKMSSLGELVAGLAHEINTPIGIGVTAASFLNGSTRETYSSLESNTMRKSELEEYFKNAQKSSDLILSNLKRTAELIGSFKMVSTDQTRDDIRRFNVKTYIEDIVRSLRPALKKGSHQISIDGEDDLQITHNPGFFAQIITNLVMNSLNHAFHKDKPGEIIISLVKKNGEHVLTYHDNGKGIPKKNQSKIFDPFFTTTRGEGGTGLGLHIIYNIVLQSLKGTIVCKSSSTKGTTFIITFPEYSEEPAKPKE